MRRVDAHHHVWDLARRPQPWTAAFPALQRSFAWEHLVPDLDRAGIDATVVVHTVDSAEETHELLALAAASDRVAGVVGWFDLASPTLPAALAAARAAPGGDRLVGARHQLQVEPDPGWLDRPEVRAGLSSLAAAGLAFDLVVSPHQLGTVRRAVADLGEARFVLDHAGKPPIASGDLGAWERELRALSALPNVAVKLSGLVTEADWSGWTLDALRPATEVVLDAFGPGRTMVGSDWPVCLLAATYAQVVHAAEQLLAGLDEHERGQVWAGAATRWYGLGRR